MLPKISSRSVSQSVVDTFYGYDHNLKIQEGEWYNAQNITTKEYPVFSTRKKRGAISTTTNPLGMVARDEIAYVDGTNLIYGNTTITDLGLSSASFKQLVRMGAYLLIYPDKKYVNTEDLTDKGSWTNSVTTSGTVTVKLAKQDGTEYGSYTASATAPTSPADKDLWMDTSGDPYVLKEYSSSMAMWVEITTTYLKISCTGIGSGFSTGDGITISGFTSTLTSLNQTAVAEAVDTGYIVIIGILNTGSGLTESSAVTVERKVPDMDFITECDNRIWGCKYGQVDGKPINEIYACKLGDFKNWNCFSGLSTDSYVASRGSDGKFTGAITYGGHPLFFKEGYLERVYPSNSGAHQIVTTVLAGVQDGSWRSLQVVNNIVYYKGVKGVYAYAGSVPYSVGDHLGKDTYTDARAGYIDDYYYLAMKDTSNTYCMFVYDTNQGIWAKEDSAKPIGFTLKSGELYYIDETTKKLMSINGTAGTAENALEWYAESGVIGLDIPQQKYISRFVIRLDQTSGSNFKVYVKYNEGNWIYKGQCLKSGLQSIVVPVMARRTDNMRIKISGSGECKVYSMLKYVEVGSDRP